MAVFLRFLVFALERGNIVAALGVIFHDFAIAINANAVDDGFVILGFLQFRGLVLGSDESACEY